MVGWKAVADMEAARGERWLVCATIRIDEFRAAYATTSEAAEKIAASWQDEPNNLRNVVIRAPLNCS